MVPYRACQFGQQKIEKLTFTAIRQYQELQPTTSESAQTLTRSLRSVCVVAGTWHCALRHIKAHEENVLSLSS